MNRRLFATGQPTTFASRPRYVAHVTGGVQG